MSTRKGRRKKQTKNIKNMEKREKTMQKNMRRRLQIGYEYI